MYSFLGCSVTVANLSICSENPENKLQRKSLNFDKFKAVNSQIAAHAWKFASQIQHLS